MTIKIGKNKKNGLKKFHDSENLTKQASKISSTQENEYQVITSYDAKKFG